MDGSGCGGGSYLVYSCLTSRQPGARGRLRMMIRMKETVTVVMIATTTSASMGDGMLAIVVR